MNTTIEYYENNAESFSQGTLNVDFSDVQDRFASLMPDGAFVLDFGCGSGRDTKYFLGRGFKVDAIDGSENLCKIAYENTGIEVRNMLFSDLDADEIYDGIWACSSILHLPKVELRDVFRRMIRALKKDGYIYTSFKYGEAEGLRKGRYFTDFTEEAFREFIREIPEMEIIDEWVSADVRPGRSEEKWLNVILKKRTASTLQSEAAKKSALQSEAAKKSALQPEAEAKSTVQSETEVKNTVRFDIYTYGDPAADILLVQMVDDHDLEVIESEVSFIEEFTGGQSFCLKAVKVDSWNKDLSPWPAPAVFGREDFGAGETLAYLLKEAVPQNIDLPKKVYIGGYSLAGLFALWAGYQTDVFSGIAAASPSIWFPGFTEYMKENELHARAVYLSLGDREERTRNPVMARVGDAIREAYAHLQETGVDCVLEWNKGNHFKEPDLRTARAFAWVMEDRSCHEYCAMKNK